ncbi:MAG TPA: hypothetical protein VGB87_14950, partial [Vicinamibacteria bacterium]
MANPRDGHCLPRLLALALAALTLLPASWALAQATGLAGVVVAERENPEGGASLLFGSGEVPGSLADSVRLTLPRQLRSPKPGFLPPGWACAPSERVWVCQGPPTPTPDRIRFDYLSGSAKKVDYEVLLSGRTVAGGRGVGVDLLPGFEVRTSLEGLFQLPPEIYPGQRLDLRLLDKAKLSPDAARLGFGWTWTIGGATPYAEGPNVRVVDPPAPIADERLLGIEHALLPAVLTGATPRVFPGDVACVRGLFPPGSFSGLRLNGQSLGLPLTASDTVTWFRIPPLTPPGPIEITGDPGAGFRPADAVKPVVIRVNGSIDRSKLLRGESTTLRLWLDGTDAPTSLALKNHTPGIIRLDGGNEQTVTTSGGSPNDVVRKVDAVKPGDFNLTYSLEGAQCPPVETEDILSEIGPLRSAVETPPASPPPPPASKPPSNERKAVGSCGPDVTDALVEALNRIYERSKALGIDERGVA